MPRKKKTTEEFIQQAKSIHGDKYDYSKVEYINVKNTIIIICPIHNYEFIQYPGNHLAGNGCSKCYHEKRKYTTEDFINRATIVHKNKYKYDDVIYKASDKKVCITCDIHGKFHQTPNSHL